MNINTPENLEAVRKHYNILYGKSENNTKKNNINKNNAKKENNMKHAMTTRSKAKTAKNRKNRKNSKSTRKH